MECSAAGWDCTTLGVLSLGTTIVVGYFLVKMVNSFRATRLHAFETIMVALAGAQTLVSTIHFLIVHSPSLEFTVKWFRSLLIACSLANTMSPLLYGWPRMSAALMPGTGLVVFYLTILYIVALASADINCSHPTWLVMSVSDAIMALSFAAGGFGVLRALAKAQGAGGSHHTQSYLALKTTQLRILSIVNSSASVLQLSLDLIVGLQYSESRGCQLLESQNAMVLLFLIALRILSYAIPVWVIVYTFYWLPRRQYTTDMDLHLDAITEDLVGNYALINDDAGAGNLAGSLDKRKNSGGAEALMDRL